MSEVQTPPIKENNTKLNEQQSTNTQTEQFFQVQRIFMKGSSFEAVALTTELLKTLPNPTIDLQVQANFNETSKHNFEAVLTVLAIAKVKENILWKAQIQQAGHYNIQGLNEEQCKQVLLGFCMNQLYPYASATVTTMVTQSGFPPAYLVPMDFDMLYQEQLKKETSSQTN